MLFRTNLLYFAELPELILIAEMQEGLNIASIVKTYTLVGLVS
jgi:hypothetical protein